MSEDDPADGPAASRRAVLGGVGGLGAALSGAFDGRKIVRAVGTSDGPDRVFEADPGGEPGETFPQSVGSGGPTTSGVILWTRVDPGAYVADEPLAVEVATDESFTEVVHRGVVDADAVDPAHDYTVKVDLDGELDSDREYAYRFTYDGQRSRVGRCRTLPTAEDDPEELSVALVTCQDYQNGYFPAFDHVADEDVDYLLHLGDFVYEGVEGQALPVTEEPVRELSVPSGAPKARTLADFRQLYRTYRRDRSLQRAMERHTMVAGWDDHEIANDRYWDYAVDAPGYPEREGLDPEEAVEISANGIQAWVEYVPARVEYDPDAEDLHEQFRLWRSLSFGDLVDLAVTDERLFREQPPGENFEVVFDDPDPDRSMLGDRQRDWFEGWLEASTAEWTLWLNEVLTVPLTLGPGGAGIEVLHDSWDGYAAARRRLMEAVDRADLANFLTVTGDLHAAMAGVQSTHYPASSDPEATVGVELMAPPITSANAAEFVTLPGDWDEWLFSGAVKGLNDHLEFVDWYHHGYSTLTITREGARFTVYAVDKSTPDAGPERSVLTSLYTPAGEDRLLPAPDAVFEGSATVAAVGDPLTFDATASRPGAEDESIEAYRWRFDDGTVATGPVVEHSFAAPGRHTVRLTVENAAGAVDTASARVTVSGPTDGPPTAFDVAPETVAAGESVTVSVREPDPAVEYRWRFGDDATATGPTADHAYESAGDYTVTLAATDAGGTTTVERRVPVTEPAVPDCATTGRVSTREGSLAGAEDATGFRYDYRTDDPCRVEVRLDGPETADLDLYVGLDGSVPDTDDYDRRSWGYGSEESVLLDDPPDGTGLGLLVHSYRGAGAFELVVREFGTG